MIEAWSWSCRWILPSHALTGWSGKSWGRSELCQRCSRRWRLTFSFSAACWEFARRQVCLFWGNRRAVCMFEAAGRPSDLERWLQGGEKQGKVTKLSKNEVLMLNIGSMCTGARVIAVRCPSCC